MDRCLGIVAFVGFGWKESVHRGVGVQCWEFLGVRRSGSIQRRVVARVLEQGLKAGVFCQGQPLD